MNNKRSPAQPVIFLFHKLINGGAQVVQCLLVVIFHGINDAVADMILQNDLADIVDGRLDRCQLYQHLTAVSAILHHFLHAFQMTDESGQAVDNSFAVFVDMGMAVVMAVSDTVGVEIFMIVRMFHGSSFTDAGRI